MNTKLQILNMLKENEDKYLSGTELAGQLKVSRNAVCKAVAALKDEGWNITAATNRGYKLLPTDILSAEQIKDGVGAGVDLDVRLYSQLDSTNSTAVSLASDGAKEWTLVVADSQNMGRGRKGREFFSPKGTGIYMSLVLRPKFSAEKSLFVTAAAAVAAARAIENAVGKEAKIKWVNDVYCGDKKVCGILTEAAMDVETGGLKYIVVGVGINVYAPFGGFPESLRKIAAEVLEGDARTNLRNRIISAFITEFHGFYDASDNEALMTEYKERSNVLGREIRVYCGKDEYDAVALDVDENGALIVKKSDGGVVALNSGEITIRPR